MAIVCRICGVPKKDGHISPEAKEECLKKWRPMAFRKSFWVVK